MFTVTDFEATVLDRGLIQSDRVPAWTAIIKHENGDWIGLSRYIDEDCWIADCAFRENGFPVFSNGTGSRVTAGRAISDETVISMLNEKADQNPLN